ncbi:tetratricopeptide repeat protein [Streptomyces sp. NPDC001135]
MGRGSGGACPGRPAEPGNLANVLIDARQRQEAARLLRSCLDGYRRVFGPGHPLVRSATERLDWLRDHPAQRLPRSRLGKTGKGEGPRTNPVRGPFGLRPAATAPAPREPRGGCRGSCSPGEPWRTTESRRP